jgi:hypothetical protein
LHRTHVVTFREEEVDYYDLAFDEIGIKPDSFSVLIDEPTVGYFEALERKLDASRCRRSRVKHDLIGRGFTEGSPLRWFPLAVRVLSHRLSGNHRETK